LDLLADDRPKVIFIEELKKSRQKHGYLLLGYTIMPNHVHLVICPNESTTLGRVIGTLKSSSARRIIDVWKDENPDFLRALRVMRDDHAKFVFWQRRCYDHNCRTAEDVREKINYCHMNPVRAGLVSNSADWRWSSYGWYHGERGAILEIDPFEA
jgi:putative transposase